MNDITTTAPFIGWRRHHPRSKWFAVAFGETRAACWDDVLKSFQRSGSGEAMVLEAGRDPNRPDAHRRGGG